MWWCDWLYQAVYSQPLGIPADHRPEVHFKHEVESCFITNNFWWIYRKIDFQKKRKTKNVHINLPSVLQRTASDLRTPPFIHMSQCTFQRECNSIGGRLCDRQWFFTRFVLLTTGLMTCDKESIFWFFQWHLLKEDWSISLKQRDFGFIIPKWRNFFIINS